MPDEVSCPRCSIATRTAITLAIPLDVTDGFPLAVRVDSQARYWVFRRAELPALFDAEGTFLGVVGRSGLGPGEYVQAQDVFLVGRDTLVVVDNRTRRATVLDGRLTMVRSIAVPLALNTATVVSWPDTIMASGAIALAESRGPLHRLSFARLEAVLQASFRPTEGEMPPEMMIWPTHLFSEPRNGRFWTVWERAYDLRQWTADGTRLRSIERRPSWFPGVSPTSYDWRNEPPPSHIADIEEDSEGLLWVYVRVARATWREAWADAPADALEARPKSELLFATMIEVIDPRRGRVITRQTLENYLIGAVPDRRAAFYEINDRDEGRVVVKALSIVRTPGKP